MKRPRTTQPAYVHVWHRADDPEALLRAYETSHRDLAGTPGLTSLELLCSVSVPGRFLLVMSWTDLAAYQAWERGPAHRGHVSPMRPFQDRERPGGHYEVYETCEFPEARETHERHAPTPQPSTSQPG
ncbi:antibiotic biosynthesis monooxygenase family protein [Streptomyces acidicola]|uniref:antibiotic biosynthesis monooxygenase family protein n=1 Tax=Streptomyces acidicola TaxID=2596892 RepID=UPI0038298369